MSITSQLTDDYLCLSWGENTLRPCLSSAPLNGGLFHANRILNLRVNGEHTTAPPETTLQYFANIQNWQGSTIGLMTAASMNSMRYRRHRYRSESMELWLTCGLSNARCAGDKADWPYLSSLPPKPGTINIIFATSFKLEPAAMVELSMLLTEAKCSTLQALNIKSPISNNIATGTGTDALVIVAGSGKQERWVGKHTEFGEITANLLIDALTASINKQLDEYRRISISETA